MFYVDRGTGCYGGEYAKESSDTWVVNLKLLSAEDSDPEPHNQLQHQNHPLIVIVLQVILQR